MHLPRALALALPLLLACATSPANAEKNPRQTLTLLWWNVENLFDTRNDPNTDDDEFTPEGRRAWTEKKLLLKQVRIATVFRAISADQRFRGFPDIVAFAESENREVFSNTLRQAGMEGWKTAYHESPDPRGIDIGLAWNPKTVTLANEQAYRVRLPNGRRTRDVLVAGFSSGKQRFELLLNHWPSRSFDAAWSEPSRLAAAAVARHIVDSLRARNPKAAIIVMGDFNDQPGNRSIQEVLGGSTDRAAVTARNSSLLYNCWNELPEGGSYLYRGRWERIDQVLLSPALLGHRGLHLTARSFVAFRIGDMVEASGKRLFSTYEGARYRGGYSDHLPLLLKLSVSGN